MRDTSIHTVYQFKGYRLQGLTTGAVKLMGSKQHAMQMKWMYYSEPFPYFDNLTYQHNQLC